MTKKTPERHTEDPASAEHDAHAVRETLDGDLSAFDRLIVSYQRRAVAVAYRLLGSVDDAQEVAQEAFLKAFRSLATLEEPSRFGAWLIRIVSNLSLNLRRGRRPRLSLATNEEDDGLHADLAPSQMPVDPIEASELRKAIASAMDGLPEAQRLALVLFALEAIPQKEVAEIMECSVEMVKWNVFQARKTLKEQLGPYLEE